MIRNAEILNRILTNNIGICQKVYSPCPPRLYSGGAVGVQHTYGNKYNKLYNWASK